MLWLESRISPLVMKGVGRAYSNCAIFARSEFCLHYHSFGVAMLYSEEGSKA